MTERFTPRTTASRGLDLDTVPMRLFDKSKRLTWDPAAISLDADREHWARVPEIGRYALTGVTSMFQVGEESVVGELLPIVVAVARRGWLEEEMYLTAFLYEEAKHTEFFRRWLGAVLGDGYELSENLGPGFRRLFLEILPDATRALYADDSSEAFARAVVTYNLVGEGIVAETGYYAYARQLAALGSFPGLAEGVRYLRRDESRHIRFGLYLVQRLISEEPALWKVVQDQLALATPPALSSLMEHASRFKERFGAEAPMLVPLEEIQAYAVGQMDARQRALERARDVPAADLWPSILAEIDQDQTAGT